jgi:hypothetical protein
MRWNLLFLERKSRQKELSFAPLGSIGYPNSLVASWTREFFPFSAVKAQRRKTEPPTFYFSY